MLQKVKNHESKTPEKCEWYSATNLIQWNADSVIRCGKNVFPLTDLFRNLFSPLFLPVTTTLLLICRICIVSKMAPAVN